MLESTKAIVLKSIKFKDNSHIIQSYTMNHGRLSFVLHGSNSKKRYRFLSVLQPLTFVDIIYNFKPGKEIQTVQEIKCSHPFESIPFDVRKSAIALFLSEILTRCLQEEEKNEQLFKFISLSIESLDSNFKYINHFHILFLFKLTKYLGFYPINNYTEERKFFNLSKGEFVSEHCISTCLNETYTHLFYHLFNVSIGDDYAPVISRKEKNEFLEIMLKYYSFHHFNMNNIKALSVLNELFD